MAVDYPDYSPTYLVKQGKIIQIGNKETIPATEFKILFSIYGKGYIYGGFLVADNTLSSHKTDAINYEIDGQLFAESLERLDLYCVDHPHCFPYFLRKFDDTNYVYAVALSSCVNFELSVVIEYVNNGTDQIDAEAFIFYALLK